jgi:hypothetical protein
MLRSFALACAPWLIAGIGCSSTSATTAPLPDAASDTGATPTDATSNDAPSTHVDAANGDAPAPQEDAHVDTGVAVVDAGGADAPPPTSGSLASTCTGANACTGRVTIAGTTFTLPYVSSAKLEGAGSGFTHLVVFIEGFNRQAQTDFGTMIKAATAAGALGSTIVVTPEFQALTDAKGVACGGHVDTPAATDLVWQCDDWSDGMFSNNATTVSSYGALDALVSATLASNPSIARVTIAGFSAGGQFTQRYAAANLVDGAFSAHFDYVVGDPSSYVYLDGRRPVNASNCTPTGCPDGFAIPDAGGCSSYDNWRYGVQKLQGGAAALNAPTLVAHFTSRTVTYLLGTADNAATTAADVSQLDTSCSAEEEGPFRYQRGLGFFFAATTLYGATGSRLSTVDGCAHSTSCVFQSDAGVAAVFAP